MYKLLNFNVHKNYDGNLVALEEEYDLPFKLRRVYYIWGTKHDVIRGRHAHRNLQQVVVCMSGSCDFILDDGKNRDVIHLDSPIKGLYISHNIWREFTNFSPDCLIVVFASEHYAEEDYIRSYDQFLKEIK
ncbi:MAG: FdtA/QdtA family cupin domain-containing protein [Succinivibrionaceae bacterium]|nr:FdtA/QdtA family cupin domain-containing protein [Succinivibrionaceae bacterium]